ncbi:relaxase/mobilization nuclease domain-containing protein [Mucilaginibacter terrae]|uniref:MobA/VirD2-like nuclease domain-containing protein n=1 Tax=Mucilaginibacter terrae TaxID=1955052 RepID=A0ABU3GVJ0_9SPHI|nr:relaxase/mobilization nuclease domain-containing protein [Mucilaginibacter terrae]MDT3403786.1 hypothetical protein [Mucilaginibacter terrae]
MTADQVKGKGFKGALSYNLAKVAKGVAEVLASTFSRDDNAQAILKEVNLVRMQRPNLAKYFYHTSLNFPVHEDLKNEQMKAIAGDYLTAMGFGDNQHIIFRHYDADHPHLHILVNRIGYDGSLVSDSNDYKRSEQALRQMEKQYGLTEVISSKEAKERAMTKSELEMMKRTDEPSAKLKLQVLVGEVIESKHDLNIQTFIGRLEAKGVNVMFNQASTGFVSGISYGYEGLQFKGAHLGNAYKWQAIKTGTGYEQERDRTAIHEANVRTIALRAERTAAGEDSKRTAGKRTKQANGKRTNAGHSQNGAASIPEGTGELQKQLEQRSGAQLAQIAGSGHDGNQPGLSDPKDRNSRKGYQQSAEQGRQQVGNPSLPHSDLISDLLGVNDPGSGMAPVELTQNRRWKKKKKRGLSH